MWKAKKAEPSLEFVEGQKLLEGLGAPELVPPEHAPRLGKGRLKDKTQATINRQRSAQAEKKTNSNQMFTNEK